MLSLERMVAGSSARGVSAMRETDLLVVGNTSDTPFRAPIGSKRLTVRTKKSQTVHVFGSQLRVAAEHFSEADTVVYSIGRPTHASLRGRDLLSWIRERIAANDTNSLRDVYGTFVFIIDDRRNRTVSFVSDVLGMFPWFVGENGGRLVAGNNVLAIAAAGFSDGSVNYDEVSSWLRYNQPCDTGSVLADYRCVKPGSVTTYRPDGSLVQEHFYVQLEFGNIDAPQEQVIEESFEAISQSIRIQTRDLAEVNMPLSGGYDSRMVFAIASQIGEMRLHVATQKTREYEVELAQRVAEALDHPLELIPGRTRILDLFDDPFCITPGGFITGRNLTSNLARHRPGMPLLSGFMGDGVMRGSLLASGRAHFAKDAEGLSLDELTAAIDKRYFMHAHRLGLLNERIRKRVETRAVASLRKMVQAGQATSRPMVYADLYCRNRHYYSNIVLQHLDTAAGIPPYVNFASMNARVKYHHTCFDETSYPKLFARYFPQLSGIPHTFQMESKQHQKRKGHAPATRHHRRWSADLAAGLLLTGVLEGARKKKIFSLLPSGLLGEAVYQEEITFLYKLMTFERTLQRHGIRFDWNKLAR